MKIFREVAFIVTVVSQVVTCGGGRDNQARADALDNPARTGVASMDCGNAAVLSALAAIQANQHVAPDRRLDSAIRSANAPRHDRGQSTTAIELAIDFTGMARDSSATDDAQFPLARSKRTPRLRHAFASTAAPSSFVDNASGIAAVGRRASANGAAFNAPQAEGLATLVANRLPMGAPARVAQAA